MSVAVLVRRPGACCVLAAIALLALAGEGAPTRSRSSTAPSSSAPPSRARSDYWVKTEAGETRTIPKDSVKSVQKGVRSDSPAAARPRVGATPPRAGAGTPTAPATAGTTATGVRKKVPLTFDAATARANAVTKPIAAVAIWQEFLDTKPAAAELAAAKAEMAKWQELTKGEAEKIKGRWVAGEERKAILEKANTLNREGWDLMKGNQTLQAITKFEQAVAEYPNSFRATFLLGYLNMLQHKAPEAQKFFDAALKLKPDSPETLSNLALLQVNKRQHARAIQMLHKAAQGRDSKEIVTNLCAAISVAPRQVRNNATVKPALAAATLLAGKYGVAPGGRQFVIVGLHEEDAKSDRTDAMAGVMSSGTGFLINADGLILTNRHVVDKGKTFMVMLNDGTQRSADVVVLDDAQDLALVRVKNDEKKVFPVVRLAAAAAPADGAECTVMGFPLIDRLGANIKITRGIVSSGAARASGPDVVLDAKVNPGNSGGPILDKHGNVMAIVSMKSIATALEDSYGLGISAGNVRKFLLKNKVTVEAADPGTTSLSAEEIAAKVKPATVCILATQ